MWKKHMFLGYYKKLILAVLLINWGFLPHAN